MRAKHYALLALALLLGLGLFLFRPWSAWSPATMNTLFWPSQRVQHFQHMDRVFPFRRLQPSSRPYRFAQAPARLPEHYAFQGQQRPLRDFIEKTQTTGLLVLRDGNLVYEEYRQGASPSSTLTSWSVAKSVVATLVGMALYEGKIRSLDDKAEAYVPALRGHAYGRATIKDLLRMSSGVRWDETYQRKTSDINQLFYKVFIFGKPVNEVIAPLPAEQPPGQRFHYKSVDTQVLGWVLSAAVGQNLSQYAQRRLWQPLGMQDAAFWSLDRTNGTELAYCCLNMSLRDYAKLGQLYLQQGEWQGLQLLPLDWVKESTKRPEPWLAAGNGYEERGYGYHWWVPRDPDQEFFANGVWGQTIYVDEKTRTVIVKTSVDPDFQAHTAEMIAFMRGLAAGLQSPAAPSIPLSELGEDMVIAQAGP